MRVILFLSLILMSASSSLAGITLDLVSSDPDGVVDPGETLTVSVLLGYTGAPEPLDLIAATVEFDPLVWGTPVITAGSIIPSPGSLAHVDTALPGTADVLYDTFLDGSALPITTAGVLFSFEIAPIGTGTAPITFAFADAASGPSQVTTTPGAEIDVRVVPELGTTWLVGVASLAALTGLRLRSRRRSRLQA